MAKVSALRTGKQAGPPPLEAAPKNLDQPARDKAERKGKIEFSVPESMIEEFSSEAARRFGFRKGSKSQMFVALWEEYKARQSG